MRAHGNAAQPDDAPGGETGGDPQAPAPRRDEAHGRQREADRSVAGDEGAVALALVGHDERRRKGPVAAEGFGLRRSRAAPILLEQGVHHQPRRHDQHREEIDGDAAFGQPGGRSRRAANRAPGERSDQGNARAHRKRAQNRRGFLHRRNAGQGEADAVDIEQARPGHVERRPGEKQRRTRSARSGRRRREFRRRRHRAAEPAG